MNSRVSASLKKQKIEETDGSGFYFRKEKNRQLQLWHVS
jgi:hypothetical protein